MIGRLLVKLVDGLVGGKVWVSCWVGVYECQVEWWVEIVICESDKK